MFSLVAAAAVVERGVSSPSREELDVSDPTLCNSWQWSMV